ncbi:MAG: mitochondrial fission ELM1 family protein [Desulfofustis sp.]|nr:mitochondrial fission ELM1 family protein [Desulfofustis sp.]
MQALQVTLFSDGRPGHEKQSLGIIKALQAYVNVDVDKVEVPDSTLFDDLVSHLSLFFKVGKTSHSDTFQKTDLFIGSGRRTHVPMLSARATKSAKIVTCMTPASYLRAKFDLCCVPYHDLVKPADNIFFTVGPPNISKKSSVHDPKRSLILVGGQDESSHSWNEMKLISDMEVLISTTEQISWLISSSPRTPESTETLISQKLDRLPRVSFVPFSETDPGWVEHKYGTHESVWITADSVSMVYEALSAGCKVGILPVVWRRKNNKFRRSLDYLLDEKLIVTLPQYLEGASEWHNHEPLNEADRCAREILRRWWPKNIQ